MAIPVLNHFSDIYFSGKTTSVTVNDKAVRVGVDCGNCKGKWDWSSLYTAGGTGNKIASSGVSVCHFFSTILLALSRNKSSKFWDVDLGPFFLSSIRIFKRYRK